MFLVSMDKLAEGWFHQVFQSLFLGKMDGHVLMDNLHQGGHLLLIFAWGLEPVEINK